MRGSAPKGYTTMAIPDALVSRVKKLLHEHEGCRIRGCGREVVAYVDLHDGAGLQPVCASHDGGVEW